MTETAGRDVRVALGVVVYTTGPGCMQCAMTERAMRELGIPFTKRDLTMKENAAAREYVASELGYTRAPVVVVDDQDHWSGFDPDNLRRVAMTLAANTEVSHG
jgi:glutaredoxin-like protein NrdH